VEWSLRVEDAGSTPVPLVEEFVAIDEAAGTIRLTLPRAAGTERTGRPETA
jgi:hypothetical protein